MLMTADAAKRLGVTPAAVRVLARGGKLPHVVTVGGVRLFKLADVERLAVERATRRTGP